LGGELHKFTLMLVDVIDHLTRNKGMYPGPTIHLFSQQIRHSYQYLSGSTTKESPYEIIFCLEHAVRPWVIKETIITTGLTYGQDFHFQPADPWDFIKLNITSFSTNNYDPKLIFIRVPRLYIHKPLYCIPLFHELEHFVDISLGVTIRSLLLAPASPYLSMSVMPVPPRHRMEHFADLFAASYVGRSSIETLLTIAPNDAASVTHPSTADRVRIVDDFLSGSPSNIVDLFQNSLSALGAPTLTKHFLKPDLTQEIDDIRPDEIKNLEELYGMFEAAWKYLANLLDYKQAPWASNVTDSRIEQIINDLTEKSIRSYAIIERWNRGTP
jgi:hypothetical protein